MPCANEKDAALRDAGYDVHLPAHQSARDRRYGRPATVGRGRWQSLGCPQGASIKLLLESLNKHAAQSVACMGVGSQTIYDALAQVEIISPEASEHRAKGSPRPNRLGLGSWYQLNMLTFFLLIMYVCT